MVWTQLKILLPSFAGYWIFLTGVFTITYFLVSRRVPRIPFQWGLPVILSTATVVVMIGNTSFNLIQNVALYNFQQKQKSAENTEPSPGAAAGKNDTAKADFLKAIGQLIDNPAQLNDEAKAKVFTQFGQIFKQAGTKQEYFNNISMVYQCQRYFWEDALASYQSKKEIKSDARIQCEKAPGGFFNREKLIDAETAKRNAETISKLAAHQRMPASDGKTMEVNEGMIRNELEREMASLTTIQKLFQ